MTVFLRYLAFSNRLPRSFAPFVLPDGSKAEDLLRAIQTNWAETGIGSQEERENLATHALFASNGRVLHPDEPLEEGQNISVIGPIIGG
jgi:hypothetical protein